VALAEHNWSHWIAGAWIYTWVWSLEGAVASLSHFRVGPCDLLKRGAVTKLLARCCA